MNKKAQSEGTKFALLIIMSFIICVFVIVITLYLLKQYS